MNRDLKIFLRYLSVVVGITIVGFTGHPVVEAISIVSSMTLLYFASKHWDRYFESNS